MLKAEARLEENVKERGSWKQTANRKIGDNRLT